MSAAEPPSGFDADGFGLDANLGSSFPPLPPGRHRLPADFVASYQRQRIVAALVETVRISGPLSITVTDIVKAAGISRRTFYEHFADLDECFDSTCDQAFDLFFDPFAAAYAGPGLWAERLDSALRALLGALAAEPFLGELCLVHAPARQADRRTYRRAVETLTEALRGAREVTTFSQEPSPLGEELLAEGSVALIAARLTCGQGERLQELAPQLVRMLRAPLELEPADWGVSAFQS
jgi:AcrR family transcriptional regulator